LVMTDDLGAMKAVTNLVDLPEAVRQAIAAGADVALWSSGGRVGEVLDGLEAALANGGLTQERVSEALHRVLKAKDLLPYQDIKTYGPVAVMVGHLDVPGLTDGGPATLSPAAYRLLRDDYRFDGLVMTDDLGAMKAVTNLVDLPEAVRQALAAGADVALWSSGGRVGEVLDGLEAAMANGGLTKERVTDALHRVLKSKGAC
ncbi:MAG: glycoside hydrolase family 3 N-terminal domain-containing protein, partial [Umezawaea sp.]